jgi:hypothetical protein
MKARKLNPFQLDLVVSNLLISQRKLSIHAKILSTEYLSW